MSHFLAQGITVHCEKCILVGQTLESFGEAHRNHLACLKTDDHSNEKRMDQQNRVGENYWDLASWESSRTRTFHDLTHPACSRQLTEQMSTKIVIGSDHAGFEMKTQLVTFLKEKFPEYVVEDVGTNSTASVDYPVYGHKVGQTVMRDHCQGIVVCGSGIGISIACNKIPGIRCALCHNVETATLCRQHNDANVISIGARIIDLKTAQDCITAFLTTPFEGGRHQNRIDLIEKPQPL
ncbi:putative Ribose-5-phosphate isomerase B [Blattamonas nauphoetae]|uniref:Ribose-5-phosphate isomerase B n=1 Tax=Blattamonas nauphoetae TaxID=2049346 RepID=A0ABQ9WLA4_9EUKA|nr:putative Ribose-5-phosphate isomerase B [Blattamonas nauphoetae]KAK2940452.1 putative Ribose-5-phosphate isomerase B [Blattamonas nauphoetae]